MAKKDGKKGRKIGRNKKSCEIYAKTDREVVNRRRRLRRHLRRMPGDAQAMAAFIAAGGTEKYLTSLQSP